MTVQVVFGSLNLYCTHVDSALFAASVSDIMTVSHEFVSEFIEMYHENSLLWKVKCKEYSDQVKKNSALNV